MSPQELRSCEIQQELEWSASLLNSGYQATLRRTVRSIGEPLFEYSNIALTTLALARQQAPRVEQAGAFWVFPEF